MSRSRTCEIFPTNPDITSIWIRTDLYLTLLITAFVPGGQYTSKLFKTLDFHAALYGVTLTTTAIVQTAQDQLDILHASLLILLVALLSSVYARGLHRFAAAKERNLRMYMVLASQVASTVMSICWASYVWAAGSRFGPVSVCNATALDAVALPLATIINTPIPILCGCLLWYPYSSLHHISRRNTQPLEDLKQQQQPGEKMEVQTRFRSHLRASQLYVAFEILLVTFSVALIELMIRVYGSYFEPREGSWTFGQVIALVLLSDTALEILSASYAWRTGPS